MPAKHKNRHEAGRPGADGQRAGSKEAKEQAVREVQSKVQVSEQAKLLFLL